MQRCCLILLALLCLSACGGSAYEERRNQFIDQCTIEAGPLNEPNNVAEYCRAKWRQSQREQ